MNPKHLLPARYIRDRYRICNRTLTRWTKKTDLSFPAPILINRRRYFDEAALIEWERQRAGGKGAVS